MLLVAPEPDNHVEEEGVTKNSWLVGVTAVIVVFVIWYFQGRNLQKHLKKYSYHWYKETVNLQKQIGKEQ